MDFPHHVISTLALHVYFVREIYAALILEDLKSGVSFCEKERKLVVWHPPNTAAGETKGFAGVV